MTLQDLKPGDKVAIRSYRGSTNYRIVEVDSVTKTQVRVRTNRRPDGTWSIGKYRSDGSEIGGDRFYSTTLTVITPDIEAEVRMDRKKWQARRLLDKIVIPEDETSLDDLIAALKPYSKEQ